MKRHSIEADSVPIGRLQVGCHLLLHPPGFRCGGFGKVLAFGSVDDAARGVDQQSGLAFHKTVLADFFQAAALRAYCLGTIRRTSFSISALVAPTTYIMFSSVPHCLDTSNTRW